MRKTSKPEVPKEADDKEQSEAFIKAAREVEATEDPEVFEHTFAKVVRYKPQKETKKKN